MARYIKKMLALAVAVALPFVIWIGVLLAIPDHRGGSIAATIRYKTDLLQSTEGPRVIFAGGSSSPYGTVCAEVAQQLDCNAICVGATAYLGLPFYLRMLEVYAEEGDVIVLAPEYSLLTGESTDYSLVWEGAGQDPDVWRCLPVSYLPGMFSSSVSYLKLKLEALPYGAGGYNEAFGPLGDVTLYREPLLENGYVSGDPIDFSPSGFTLKISSGSTALPKRWSGARSRSFSPLRRQTGWRWSATRRRRRTLHSGSKNSSRFR